MGWTDELGDLRDLVILLIVVMMVCMEYEGLIRSS